LNSVPGDSNISRENHVNISDHNPFLKFMGQEPLPYNDSYDTSKGFGGTDEE
jgi:hypothetical protein